MDLADLNTSADEFGTHLRDVVNHQMHAANASRLTGVHIKTCPKADRATGTFRSQLHDPAALAWLHIVVLVETELV
jgi:hypothetical protein